MELATTGFAMTTTRGFITGLGTLKNRSRSLEITLTLVGIKHQRKHQRVGGVADLAQGDGRIFPPEAARFGGPKTGD